VEDLQDKEEEGPQDKEAEHQAADRRKEDHQEEEEEVDHLEEEGEDRRVGASSRAYLAVVVATEAVLRAVVVSVTSGCIRYQKT